MTPAVFLDRDGTLIVEREYLADPEGVEFTPGAAEAVRKLRARGFMVVVVSNQAGLARGLFAETAVHAVHRRIEALLRVEGTHVDGYYFCPHHPEFTGPCRCRKPEPGMLLDAARDLELDLARSWMVGDRLSDVEAGVRAGARGILVRTGYGDLEEKLLDAPGSVKPAALCEDLAGAAEVILETG
ncbi:MAG: HAD family hydrolase [Candidatus Eisenbacteria bacterium]|nr:HAD family hydrolase [Candidatus Eisenbacteria bacterium]